MCLILQLKNYLPTINNLYNWRKKKALNIPSITHKDKTIRIRFTLLTLRQQTGTAFCRACLLLNGDENHTRTE